MSTVPKQDYQRKVLRNPFKEIIQGVRVGDSTIASCGTTVPFWFLVFITALERPRFCIDRAERTYYRDDIRRKVRAIMLDGALVSKLPMDRRRGHGYDPRPRRISPPDPFNLRIPL